MLKYLEKRKDVWKPKTFWLKLSFRWKAKQKGVKVTLSRGAARCLHYRRGPWRMRKEDMGAKGR